MLKHDAARGNWRTLIMIIIIVEKVNRHRLAFRWIKLHIIGISKLLDVRHYVAK